MRAPPASRGAVEAHDAGAAGVAWGGECGDAPDVLSLAIGLGAQCAQRCAVEVQVRHGEEGALELLEEATAHRVPREGHDAEHGEHRHVPQEDGQEGPVCASDAQRADCGEVERVCEPVYTPVTL